MDLILVNYLNFKKISILILLTLILGCQYDQVKSQYVNYQDAFDNGFFKKGWIPKILQYESMKNIFNKNNLDSNNSIFSFELNKFDLNQLIEDVELTNSEFKGIYDIDEPSDWIIKISKLQKYKSSQFKQHIAIDTVNKIIYGWKNE